MLKSRHTPFVHTCGKGFAWTVVSISPETISTLPSASVVVVGYQRPAFISGSRDHGLVTPS